MSGPTQHLVVRSRTIVAEDIVSLELAAADGRPLLPFEAGAHIELKLGNGCERSYSLVNDPSKRDRYVISVNKDPASRGGSRYVHEVLRPGHAIEVAGPRNNFRLVENASLVVLIAGGIGITPLWCMIQRLEALGRPWKLFYGARSRGKCAYLRDVQALEAKSPGRVHLHFNDECDGRVLDLPAAVAAAPADAHLYCCGPIPMLQAFEQATAGRREETVHVEYFSPREPVVCDGGFNVLLARSGRTLFVEKGTTILDKLLAEGIDVSYSCREGVCGTCQTGVLEGEPDHHDSYLTPAERRSGKTIMVCCSGSRSDKLVLDL